MCCFALIFAENPPDIAMLYGFPEGTLTTDPDQQYHEKDQSRDQKMNKKYRNFSKCPVLLDVGMYEAIRYIEQSEWEQKTYLIMDHLEDLLPDGY